MDRGELEGRTSRVNEETEAPRKQRQPQPWDSSQPGVGWGGVRGRTRSKSLQCRLLVQPAGLTFPDPTAP